MTRIIRQLIFILIAALANACSQKQPNKVDTTDSYYFFDPVQIGALNGTKNLSIKARFGECGEWGGHLETITISADKNNNFYANYKVYPFNCDSLDYYYANDTLNPIVDKKITLSDDNKNSIVSFIQRMIKSKVTERFPGHAGNYFSIINSDSSFRIEVYDTKEFDVISFRQLTDEIAK